MTKTIPATPTRDRSGDFKMPRELRARLIQDTDYKPLANGLLKYKDPFAGGVYFLRQWPDRYEEWIPMQGRKVPKRHKKLPPIAKSYEAGEALFDPAEFVERPSYAG